MVDIGSILGFLAIGLVIGIIARIILLGTGGMSWIVTIVVGALGWLVTRTGRRTV